MPCGRIVSSLRFATNIGEPVLTLTLVALAAQPTGWYPGPGAYGAF